MTFKNKRTRRTKKAIETILADVSKGLIEEVGFRNVTVSAIIQRAKIEPIVFYNRYNSLDDFFEQFVKGYEYWFSDTIHFDPINLTPVQNFENLLLGLIDGLYADESMQKILTWEISDTNEITKELALKREVSMNRMTEYFKSAFKDIDYNIAVTIALMIGGICYQILHRRISTFGGVDFNTEEGKNQLKDTVKQLTKKLVGENPLTTKEIERKKALDIAGQLLIRQIDHLTIKQVTGLSDEDFKLVLMKKAS